jgi:Skp family chaperone for outer membrane proteins
MDVSGERRGIRWYEVMYVVVLIAVLVLGLWVMNPHRVAIIDVDRVFKDVGMLQKVEQDRQKTETYLRGVEMVNAYNIRMESLKSKLEAAKTSADKEKIQAQMKSASDTLQQTLGPIQSSLQSRETAVITTFRRRLQPFINQVAQKRRADVVLIAGPSVSYVHTRVDITADVVKAAKDFFAKDMPIIDPAMTGAGRGAGARR